MKKSKRKPKATRKQANAAPPAQPVKKRLSPRDMRRNVIFGGVCLASLGVAGWALTSSVMASAAEQDLTRIGNGVPAIVQIHDRDCGSCMVLQRQTRSLLKDYPSGAVQYLVADLATPAGRQFASIRGVGRTTLLLFDGAGDQRGVLAGPQTDMRLRLAFDRLAGRS